MLLQILLLSHGCVAASGAKVRITNASDFSTFVSSVNGGSRYSGDTVFLDSDLSLSGITSPIGPDYIYSTNSQFRGVFDGQGHIISGLKVNSTSQCVGIFGYSNGMTIRNVVLDSSCSITSSYSGSSAAFVGGIIGHCDAGGGECNIENNVNMADVTFNGKINKVNLFLGGITGQIYSFSHRVYMKNCANYATITYSGTSSDCWVEIGGISGKTARNSNYNYVYNCLNYGTIIHNGISNNLIIGGIIGNAYAYAYIENCVSAGEISTPTTASSENHIGSIVGEVDSYTYIKYSYYASDINVNILCGYGTPSSTSYVFSYDNTSFGLDEDVSVGDYTGDSLVGALNAAADYYVLRGYSYWLINENGENTTFTINNRTNSIAMDFQIILLPSLASEGNISFGGWYNDTECTHPLESFEIVNDTDLYGIFKENANNYTITFDTRREGSFVAPIAAQFGAVVSLPSESIRDYCNVAFWETAYGVNVGLSLTMPARNFTLYAVWKCTHIASPDDFVDFSRLVNSGTTYSGITVLLDSDLSIPEITEPIDYFLGTFDGQGHIISDLKINSTSQYTGLFGYSEGPTIRNVVLGPSCSVTSSYSSSGDAYAGGFVGYCKTSKGYYNIKNSVNMADVTFSGNTNDKNLCLGGFAGLINSFSNTYTNTVKNCVNYGSVTHSGTSSYSYIGGIAGHLDQFNSKYIYLYNCLNYGTITHSGTSKYLYIGGIAGSSKCTYIENCVSAGKIFTPAAASANNNYIGSILGQIDSYTYIYYCYYTNGLSEFGMYGTGTPTNTTYTLNFDNTTFKLSETVFIGSFTKNSLVDALNAYSDYYILRDYSHWLLNENSNNVNFTINNRINPIAINSQVILLPSLETKGNNTFYGWYNDNKYTQPLEQLKITKDTKLYGVFGENANNYTITFNSRKKGVVVETQSARFLSTVSLPGGLVSDYCTIAFWETEYSEKIGFRLTMPAHNFTLYAVWKCTRIATVDDFIDFSKVVNTGTGDYSGTTVLLDSDLSLSKVINPIGKDTSNYFCGVFDGQGHIISDFRINSYSLLYTGLFGYSGGLTIKNVVLDSSCSIENSHKTDNEIYVGFVGYCQSNSGQCNIENNVNMADVAFSGNSDPDEVYIGGFGGNLRPNKYPVYVKNCANYGSVTHSGTSYKVFIGGIVGYLSGSISYYARLYNCFNYGTITHSGTKTYLRLGGIVGYSDYAYVENCVSAGKVSPTKADYVGSIVGNVGSYIYIKYCYFENGINANILYGNGAPSSAPYVLSYGNTSFELDDDVSVGNYTGNSLVDALNAAADYYILRDYSKWFLNKNNNNVAFTINNRANSITMDFQVILLPSLASEGSLWFNGWYNDSERVYPLDSFDIANNVKLYGRFEENTNNYTITFDTRGGSYVAPITAQFGTVVSLPSKQTRDYCSFAWWENEYGDNVRSSLAMPARNFTLYAMWKCTRITTPDDLIVFSKVVKSGTKYLGTTVFLGSDLSFSGKILEPIGTSTDNYFRGTFDGQGHTISDLIVSFSLQYTGLFGYSKGLTTRNVVLDSSCSITSSFKSDSTEVFMGGIIGKCESSERKCNIENSVNMADVTFIGSASNMYIGGFCGSLNSPSKIICVKNCVNYGPVTCSGTNARSNIGGITGDLYGDGSHYNQMYNCLNYGTVTHNGTASNVLRLGGITGYSKYTYIENCVSAGEISSTTSGYIGSIVGCINSYIHVNYCYYTSDVNASGLYGTGTPANEFNTPDSSSVMNLTLIDSLNGYASNNTWNKWVLNTNNSVITFTMIDNANLSLSSTLIILPGLASDSRSFAWFNDSLFTTKFLSSSVSENITLYGGWDMFIVHFDGNGGSVPIESKYISNNSVYGELPTPTREGHTFLGWYTNKTNGTEVTSSTIFTSFSVQTIYAQWAVNNYTLRFIFGNGTEDDVRLLYYGDNIVYPENPVREEYVFIGWDTKIKTMPGHDLNIIAQWIGNNYTITFVTRKKSVFIAPQTKHFEDIVSLPSESVGEYCTVAFWEKENGENVGLNLIMPAYNFTLYAVWKCTHITTSEDFIDFSKLVNSGVDNFIGTTVCLGSGLSLSEEMLEPIGFNSTCQFRGTFDGQGHTISDLKMNSTSKYTGLFGYSEGLTIRNVVLASSCSITSSYNGESSVGGILGYCYLHSEGCNIENSVSMAGVTFNGKTADSLHLGGVAGYLSSFKSFYVKNCANYGSVTYSGTSKYSYIGGIVGYLYSSGSNCTYFQNCLNYGTITHSGTTTNASYIGGNIGYSYHTCIENCVSSGVISTAAKPSTRSIEDRASTGKISASGISPTINIGSIVGNAVPYSNTSISNSFWTKNVGDVNVSGSGDPIVDEKTSQIELTTETMSMMNNYTTDNNSFILLYLDEGTIGSNNQEAVIATRNYVPEPSKTGHTFVYWCVDPNCTKQYDPSTAYAGELYARFEINRYILRFIFNNGTEDEVRLLYYGDKIDYPEKPVSEKYAFTEWSPNITSMPAYDLNITAQWRVKNYFIVTVTFNTSEGDISETSMDVTHDKTYGELPTPTRTGYTFVRWFTEDNETITSETTVDASENHVLYAEWVINNYTLRFVFENGTEVDVRVFDFNSYVEYPDDPVMEGYTFKKWSENITAMPASNLTITALWTINNYTLRFIFNNGAEDEVRILNYNDEIVYPAEPAKDGYTFDEWDSNITRMPAHDVNITAQWATFIVTIVFSKKNIGNVNVTEKIIEIASNNNLVIESIVKYEEDDTIRYIVKFVDRKNGEDAITNFVENIAADESLKSAISQIYINGEKTVSDDDGNVTLIIIIVVVVVVVIVVLLAGLGLFVIWRKKSIEDARKQRGAHNRIVGQKVETADASKFKSRFKNKKKIYPKDYTPPEGIYAALVNTGLDEVFAEEAANRCTDIGKNSGNKGYLTGDFTVCDAAAVCLYTFDFGGSNYEMNPYVLLNRALRAEKKKEDEIVKVRDVLYLVMSALRKLPVVKGVTLYRGIRSKVSMDEYKEGKVVVWPGFSSTSPDMNTTKAFLENTTRNDREKKERDRTGGIELSETPEGESVYGEGEETSGGTLFIIEDGWGYNVQPYSFFPDEEEILIEPEREFDVVSVMDSEGLVLITLKMRNTKKILPDIFGKGHK